VLSPILFNLFLNDLLIELHEIDNVQTLAFADDLMVIANDKATAS